MTAKLQMHATPSAYTFDLFSASGVRIMFSEIHYSKRDCQEAMRDFLDNCCSSHRFQKVNSPDGRLSFQLLNQYDKILARAEWFWSENSRDYALQLVKKECERISKVVP